jgi:hypothetical protein
MRSNTIGDPRANFGFAPRAAPIADLQRRWKLAGAGERVGLASAQSRKVLNLGKPE